MSPWVLDLFTAGGRNLLRHKLRSALTLLGVFFGVAAVITMLGIGEGAQRSVLQEISGLGLNNILIDSVQPDASQLPDSQRNTSGQRRGMRILEYGVTDTDVEQLRSACPEADIRVAHRVKASAYAYGERLDAEVLGVPPDYFTLFDSKLIEGRWLHPFDSLHFRSVALIPESLTASIRHPRDGGQPHVKIGTYAFEVVGIQRTMAPRGDRTIYIPFETAEQVFGTSSVKREAGSMEFTRTQIGQVVLHCEDEEDLKRTAAVVKRTLERNHPIVDYALTVPVEILEARQRTQRILNLVLLVIAGISLLVGGIGIMNIMLAVVTERIPEIGIRRAIGATERDILFQFLAETITLSTLGGVLGCLAGMILVPLTEIWTGWNGVITPSSVIVSLAVSWVVGVFFGLAPAVRASKLDPVDALRHG